MSPFHNFSSRDIKTSITKQNLCFEKRSEKLNLAEHENQRHISALQYMHTIHSIWLDAKDRRSYLIICLFLFYFIAKQSKRQMNLSYKTVSTSRRTAGVLITLLASHRPQWLQLSTAGHTYGHLLRRRVPEPDTRVVARAPPSNSLQMDFFQ